MTSRQRVFVATGIFVACLGWYKFQSNNTPPTSTHSADREAPSSPTLVEDGGSASVSRKPAQAPIKAVINKADMDKFINDVQNNLAQINRCYVEDCKASDDHPRTAYFEAGQGVKAELLRLNGYVKDYQVVDAKISDIARESLENADGHVQEVALDLLASQPPSPENLESILEKVIRGYDAELIAKALRELQRYQSPADQEKIRSVLAEEMLHGAPFVGQAIAKNIAIFLNRDSVSFFESVVEKIEPGSIIYNHLHSSLKEFRRRNG